ncbi:hypothetical protein [uncultured Vibrio sp.]|uniref:hypothetical protein n=1 Tax=uncultured Vibrio sp. TaxID=114054 RepID=UPI0026150DAD|nr:hypothetical protein [uncultured Vibrio sp.]
MDPLMQAPDPTFLLTIAVLAIAALLGRVDLSSCFLQRVAGYLYKTEASMCS